MEPRSELWTIARTSAGRRGRRRGGGGGGPRPSPRGPGPPRLGGREPPPLTERRRRGERGWPKRGFAGSQTRPDFFRDVHSSLEVRCLFASMVAGGSSAAVGAGVACSGGSGAGLAPSVRTYVRSRTRLGRQTRPSGRGSYPQSRQTPRESRRSSRMAVCP